MKVGASHDGSVPDFGEAHVPSGFLTNTANPLKKRTSEIRISPYHAANGCSGAKNGS